MCVCIVNYTTFIYFPALVHHVSQVFDLDYLKKNKKKINPGP